MIKSAINTPNVIIDRWVLRLGKSEEEAGRFEPWHLPPETMNEDLAGFLACLELTKLIDSVSTRMSTRKKGVRAIKKQQRAEAKEIAKMKAKVEKATAKAQLKLDRAAEKERIKRDAKAAREAAKLEKNKPDLDTGVNQATPLVTEIVANVSEVVIPTPQAVPVYEGIWSNTAGLMESPAAFGYEEAPVTRKTFVVPEES